MGACRHRRQAVYRHRRLRPVCRHRLRVTDRALLPADATAGRALFRWKVRWLGVHCSLRMALDRSVRRLTVHCSLRVALDRSVRRLSVHCSLRMPLDGSVWCADLHRGLRCPCRPAGARLIYARPSNGWRSWIEPLVERRVYPRR